MRISDWSSDVCSSDLIGIIGADGERIDRAQRDADFDAAGAGTRDIGIGERAQIEIDLVVRIAVEIRRGDADAAVEKCLFDTGIVALRRLGPKARRAVGTVELEERRRLAPFRLTRQSGQLGKSVAVRETP